MTETDWLTCADPEQTLLRGLANLFLGLDAARGFLLLACWLFLVISVWSFDLAPGGEVAAPFLQVGDPLLPSQWHLEQVTPGPVAAVEGGQCLVAGAHELVAPECGRELLD